MTSINISATTKTIGEDGTFGNCSALTEINVDSANPNYYSTDGVLFQTAAPVTLMKYPGGKAGSYSIPANVVKTLNDAFENSVNLTSVAIPAGTQLGKTLYYNFGVVFNGCSKLTDITVATTNTKYSSVDGVLFNKTQTTLSKYPEGKAGASYTIPAGVTTLEDSAFMNCNLFTSMTIPESVTIIKDNVFRNCTGLTEVTIPTGVSNIGNYAFQSCKNLQAVYFLGNAPTLGTSTPLGYKVFEDNAVGRLIYYPNDKYAVPSEGGFKGFTSPWYGYPTEMTSPPVLITPEVTVTKLEDSMQVNIKNWDPNSQYQI